MVNWKNTMTVSIIGTIIFSVLGGYWVVSGGMSGDDVTTIEAPGTIEFEGEFDQYYDIYAENPDDITITLSSEIGTDEGTYLTMCPEEVGETIGITGDCGQQRGNKELIGDLTVGAGESGKISLHLNGTGNVTIIKVSLGNTLITICSISLGCCIFPILAIFSIFKTSKSKKSQQFFYVQQEVVSQQNSPVDIGQVYNVQQNANSQSAEVIPQQNSPVDIGRMYNSQQEVPLPQSNAQTQLLEVVKQPAEEPYSDVTQIYGQERQ